jgi:hypothetical protein
MMRRLPWLPVLVAALGLALPAQAGPLAGLAKEQGNGSRFTMQAQGSTYDMQIGLVKVDQASGLVTVEVFAAAQLADPLWQQFTLSTTGARPKIENGYIQVGNKAPMKLQDKHLAGTSSLDINLFLLSESELRKDTMGALKPVGQEVVKTKAGEVQCGHYRMERPEQTLDLWISDEARPIGLIRLVSTGKKPADNYRLELQELLSGIAAKIDPKRAVPLSDEMKTLLSRP